MRRGVSADWSTTRCRGPMPNLSRRKSCPRSRARLTSNSRKTPNARATMGYSSGGACALSMAWYHPELYHRVLSYSGTFVNQQWPYNPEIPHGAWEFHEHLIPNSPRQPIRLWMEVGDRDLLNPNIMRDSMHDWVLANENMARVLAAKRYHYQFVFARNAFHVDRAVRLQTLPEALEYIWQDYRGAAPQHYRSRKKPDCNLFWEGHDFSRAVSDAKSVRLQPLRFTANVVNEFCRNLLERSSVSRASATISANLS